MRQNRTSEVLKIVRQRLAGLGHTDPATTRRYTHATDKAKRIAVEATRVWRFPVCHNSATTQERLPQATAVSA